MKKQKKSIQKIMIFCVFSFFTMLFLICVTINFLTTKTKQGNNTTVLHQSNLKSKLDVLLDNYPEFKDWETQKSFAGKTFVYTTTNDDDYYFAFITNGSGIRIIEVQCFLVRKNNSIGYVEPSNIDANTISIDPKTCTGLK